MLGEVAHNLNQAGTNQVAGIAIGNRLGCVEDQRMPVTLRQRRSPCPYQWPAPIPISQSGHRKGVAAGAGPRRQLVDVH